MTKSGEIAEARFLWPCLGLALVIISVFIAHHVTVGNLPVLARDVREALHAPGFALLTMIAMFSFRRLTDPRKATLGSLGLCFVIAIVAEGSQVFVARDADIADLGADMVGIATGLLVAGLALGDFHKDRNLGPIRGLAMVGAIVLSFFVIGPVADSAYAISAQRSALPTLASFDARWEKRLYRGSLRRGLEIVPSPSPNFASNGNAALLDLGRKGVAGLELFPSRDWRAYEQLVFTTMSATDKPVRVGLRIHDVGHNNEWNDRFGYQFIASLEPKTIRLPLSDVAKTPSGRLMDLGNIDAIIFFVSKPKGGERIYIDDIRLE